MLNILATSPSWLVSSQYTTPTTERTHAAELRSPLSPNFRQSSLGLSLVLFVGRAANGRYETTGTVQLTIPLSHLSQKPSNSKSDNPPTPKGIDTPTTSPDRVNRSPQSSPAASHAPLPSLKVTRHVARACVKAAWRAQHLDNPEHAQSMITRARYSALLPRTTVRWSRGSDQAFRLSPTQDDPYRLQQTNAGRQWFEAKATWNLDRLFFVKEELRVQHMQKDWTERRAKLAGIIIELLFTWEKLSFDVMDSSVSRQERIDAYVARSMTEMKLDILTNGWFGDWLQRNRRKDDRKR